MHYMLLLTSPPDADAQSMDVWGAYSQALIEAGVMRGGAGLLGVDTATTVQVRDGERLVTDGPFTEAKEYLGGFYIIDVPDLDTAIDWAARVPNVYQGSVEIRPTIPGTSGD